MEVNKTIDTVMIVAPIHFTSDCDPDLPDIVRQHVRAHAQTVHENGDILVGLHPRMIVDDPQAIVDIRGNPEDLPGPHTFEPVDGFHPREGSEQRDWDFHMGMAALDLADTIMVITPRKYTDNYVMAMMVAAKLRGKKVTTDQCYFPEHRRDELQALMACRSVDQIQRDRKERENNPLRKILSDIAD